VRSKLVAIALSSAVVVGCGGSKSNSSSSTPASSGGGAADGAQVFATAGCKNCHTLKAAGATGMVGPNLDQLKPAASLVEHQVTNGGGGMPSFKATLSTAQIKAVAQYVSSVAGKS
jgi:mono/diheme cytochrome c family protein